MNIWPDAFTSAFALLDKVAYILALTLHKILSQTQTDARTVHFVRSPPHEKVSLVLFCCHGQ